MKKITLILTTFLFFTIAANSQITKGNWMLGGSGSFNTDKTSSSNKQTVNVQLTPNIGYFFLDKFAGGIELDYASQDLSSYTGGLGVGLIIKRFTAGPFLRYYLLDTERVVNIFVEANYSYGTYSGSGYYTISKGKTSKISFIAGPVVYLNSNIGVELTMGYYNINDITMGISNGGLEMGIGFQIHLKK